MPLFTNDKPEERLITRSSHCQKRR